jgi:hypothetical protein
VSAYHNIWLARASLLSIINSAIGSDHHDTIERVQQAVRRLDGALDMLDANDRDTEPASNRRRCCECSEHVHMNMELSTGLPVGPRYCGCWDNPDDPDDVKQCTQDGGPAPDWCPIIQSR